MNEENISNAHMRIHINPLAFLEVDMPHGKTGQDKTTVEDVLRYLCEPGISFDVSNLVSRYHEISRKGNRVYMAPAEEQILKKLIWPLRHAKGSFMLGNYFGTIALCGMVAEMMATLLFDISDIQINQKLMDDDNQKLLYGRSFEKLGQERRVEVLRAYGLIDDDMVDKFTLVRKRRNTHLHLYSHDLDKLASDAVDVFDATVDIVVKGIGLGVSDGKIVLKPTFLAYLKKKGIVNGANHLANESGV